VTNREIPEKDVMGIGSIGNLSSRNRPPLRERSEPSTVAAAELDALSLFWATLLYTLDSF
jgi:hypothetical protein